MSCLAEISLAEMSCLAEFSLAEMSCCNHSGRVTANRSGRVTNCYRSGLVSASAQE
jgi:hypothetical protein